MSENYQNQMMKELVSCAEFFSSMCIVLLAFGDISYQKSADFWFGLVWDYGMPVKTRIQLLEK